MSRDQSTRMGQVVCMTFGLIQSKCQASRGLYHEDETVTIHRLVLAGDEIWMFIVLSSRLLGNFPVKGTSSRPYAPRPKFGSTSTGQVSSCCKILRAEHGYGLAIYTLSPGKASLPRGRYPGRFKDELEMRS